VIRIPAHIAAKLFVASPLEGFATLKTLVFHLSSFSSHLLPKLTICQVVSYRDKGDFSDAGKGYAIPDSMR
jgi:hypothetical protein